MAKAKNKVKGHPLFKSHNCGCQLKREDIQIIRKVSKYQEPIPYMIYKYVMHKRCNEHERK